MPCMYDLIKLLTCYLTNFYSKLGTSNLGFTLLLPWFTNILLQTVIVFVLYLSEIISKLHQIASTCINCIDLNQCAPTPRPQFVCLGGQVGSHVTDSNMHQMQKCTSMQVDATNAVNAVDAG